jgi:hypothetical protein
MTVEKARDMLKILQLCNKNNNNEKLKLIIKRSIFSWVLKFYQQLTGEERRIPSILTIFTFVVPELLDLM